MTSKHRKTLEKMQKHPRPANLPWRDIESLLLHVGAEIEEGKGSAITVFLKKEVASFHRPHPDKEANKGAIVNALELLKRTRIIK